MNETDFRFKDTRKLDTAVKLCAENPNFIRCARSLFTLTSNDVYWDMVMPWNKEKILAAAVLEKWREIK